jgi:hypothetical protein
MLGHIKAEEFMNVIDGGVLPAARRQHLESCAACTSKLHSIDSAHKEFSAADSDVPEPDWNEFRSSVRLELLSRSIQRDSAVRRWTGWPIRPAMAWGLSLALIVCFGGAAFFWHISQDREQSISSVPPAPRPAPPILETANDAAAIESEKAVWSTGVFEKVAQLEDEQAKQLLLMLENAPLLKNE